MRNNIIFIHEVKYLKIVWSDSRTFTISKKTDRTATNSSIRNITEYIFEVIKFVFFWGEDINYVMVTDNK